LTMMRTKMRARKTVRFVFTMLAFAAGVQLLVSESPALAQSTPPQSTLPGPALFSVSLSAGQDVVQAGSPVKIKIVTTNNSNQPLWFWKENAQDQAGYAYKADVRGQASGFPPETALGRLLRYANSPNGLLENTRVTSSGGYVSLSPGDSDEMVSDLASLYDFSAPGTYTIQIRRTAHNQAVGGIVQSNAITIHIIPAPTASSRGDMSPAEPSISLTVSPESQTVNSLTPARLKVITRNESSRSIFLWTEAVSQEQAGAAYRVEVRDTGGNSPLDTEFGRQAKMRTDVPTDPNPDAFFGPSGERLALKPGESWVDGLDLNKLYKLDHPGTYIVQVHRFDPASRTMVQSNAVTITVTQ
jgi:hypothetical protein